MNKVRSFAFVNGDSIKYYTEQLHKMLDEAIPAQHAILKYTDGIYLLTTGFHKKAASNFDQAASFFIKEKNDSLLFYCYIALGNCNKLSGNAEEAVKNYLKALTLPETISNTTSLSSCYINLAETFQHKGDVINARKYLALAGKIIPYGSRMYLTMIHLQANLFGMSNVLDSALMIDREGIALATSNNFPEKFTPFYDNIAQCFLARSNYDSAAFYFKKCIYIDSMNGRFQLMADTYSQMVNVYGMKNDPENMLHTASYADALCNSTQYLRGKYRIYEGLNNYYTGTKNWKMLSEVKDSLSQIYKRLISEETEAKIAQYNIEYETAEKQKVIEAQQYRLQKTRYIALFVGVISLLLAFVIFTSFKSYRHKKSIAVNVAIQNQKESNTQEIFKTEQKERIRIARDLHDSIGLKLSVLKMYLHNRENDAIKTPNLLDETIQEVRNISHNLLPEELNFGLISAIRSDIEVLKSAKKIKVNATIQDGRYEEFSMLSSINILRIFRELLANTLKHSKATEIMINIFITGEKLHFEISDDGLGIDKEAILKSKGLGWKNIFARIEMLKGKIEIEPKDKGSSFKIEMPIA
jgi:signal transduction histidine kinase